METDRKDVLIMLRWIKHTQKSDGLKYQTATCGRLLITVTDKACCLMWDLNGRSGNSLHRDKYVKGEVRQANISLLTGIEANKAAAENFILSIVEDFNRTEWEQGKGKK